MIFMSYHTLKLRPDFETIIECDLADVPGKMYDRSVKDARPKGRTCAMMGFVALERSWLVVASQFDIQ
jgi:hypothetical protein